MGLGSALRAGVVAGPAATGAGTAALRTRIACTEDVTVNASGVTPACRPSTITTSPGVGESIVTARLAGGGVGTARGAAGRFIRRNTTPTASTTASRPNIAARLRGVRSPFDSDGACAAKLSRVPGDRALRAAGAAWSSPIHAAGASALMMTGSGVLHGPVAGSVDAGTDFAASRAGVLLILVSGRDRIVVTCDA